MGAGVRQKGLEYCHPDKRIEAVTSGQADKRTQADKKETAA